jgi:hypothetical protein
MVAVFVVVGLCWGNAGNLGCDKGSAELGEHAFEGGFGLWSYQGSAAWRTVAGLADPEQLFAGGVGRFNRPAIGIAGDDARSVGGGVGGDTARSQPVAVWVRGPAPLDLRCLRTRRTTGSRVPRSPRCRCARNGPRWRCTMLRWWPARSVGAVVSLFWRAGHVGRFAVAPGCAGRRWPAAVW